MKTVLPAYLKGDKKVHILAFTWDPSLILDVEGAEEEVQAASEASAAMTDWLAAARARAAALDGLATLDASLAKTN